MPHHSKVHPHHSHVAVLDRKKKPQPGPQHLEQGNLPPNRFGVLVGSYDHVTLSPHDGSHPDDNHVYLWLKVPGGDFMGHYECAFNTMSSRPGSPVQKEVEYFIHETPDEAGLPSIGFSEAEVSYSKMGLKDGDFRKIENGSLRNLVMDYAQRANLIAAYGVTYKEGTGLHDMHLNASEDNGAAHESPNDNHDGMLVFYFRTELKPPVKTMIFIKFSKQHI
ncbi:MAG: hypothetical protein JSS72_07800 [Armatimonadetes bacterium]|nr:hypothetical protein [Armatimonadota bacterium]